MQPDLFADDRFESIKAEINALDVNQMTPIDALLALSQLKSKLVP
jgi:hypothetical protein